MAITFLFIYTVFAVWVVFFSGAEQIEHSLSVLIFHPLASMLSANALRAYVAFLWLVQLVKLFID